MGTRTTLPFRSRTTNLPFDPFEKANLTAYAEGPGWPGISLRFGTMEGWDADGAVLETHMLYIAFTEPESADLAQTQQCISWFLPVGYRSTHTSTGLIKFCVIFLDPRYFAQDVHLPSPSPGIIKGDEVLTRLALSLLVLAQEKNSSQLLIEQLRRALALRIVHQSGASTSGPVKGGLAVLQLKRVLTHINENIGSSLSIELLAGLVDLSPTHFARAFRESTGQPPHRFITTLRLERARDALLEPGASLATVAARFGFSDHSHFTRLFKERFGLAPSIYRRL